MRAEIASEHIHGQTEFCSIPSLMGGAKMLMPLGLVEEQVAHPLEEQELRAWVS